MNVIACRVMYIVQLHYVKKIILQRKCINFIAATILLKCKFFQISIWMKYFSRH